MYLLDTNVLYSSILRDFFITLGVMGVPIRWSDQIEAEFITVRHRKNPDHDIRTKRVLEQMRRAFPDYRAVVDNLQVEALTLPDPDDRHVLAAAISVGASVIVTSNLRDFPTAVLEQYGVIVMSPDQALCHLFDQAPDSIIKTVIEIRGRMINPTLTPTEWLEFLQAAGGRTLTTKLQAFIEQL